MNIKSFAVAVSALVLSTSVNAALFERLGGQAYYDDVLDITWLADANYGKTSGADATNGDANNNGDISWADANTLVASINIDGVTGWRLPTMIDTGSSGCNNSFSGTDCGYNVQTGSVSTTVFSELASLWTDTLGNVPKFDSDGNENVSWGLVNTGPFSNVQDRWYWTGLEYDHPNNNLFANAWMFNASRGEQNRTNKVNPIYVWAVHDGDVGVDTDIDGLPDSIEDSNSNGVIDAGETDPSNPDSDNDGLKDGEEDTNSNGVVDAGESNPLDEDSDNDGLSDGYEVNIISSDPTSQTTVYTSPGDMDGDGDIDVGDLLLLQRQLLGN